MSGLGGVVISALRWLVDAFTSNLELKLLSLVFAVGIVAFQRGQLDEQQRTVPVGVVLRLPPEAAKRELMTAIPANIHVTLRGSTRAIDSLIQAGVPPVELDLRSGRSAAIAFEPSMFSFPPNMEIKIIDPPTLSLHWEDIIERRVPLQASRTGQPAAGFTVEGNLEVEPREITVKGPSSAVEVLQFVRLAAYDVSGLTEGVHRRPIALDPPPNRVQYLGPASAMVSAVVARRETDAKFTKRPVEVVGARGARSIPAEVDVTVVGLPEVVAALRAEQVIPKVDLADAHVSLESTPHGSATVPVKVELNRAKAEVQPPTVTVRW